jgi:hypothetical protein
MQSATKPPAAKASKKSKANKANKVVSPEDADEPDYPAFRLKFEGTMIFEGLEWPPPQECGDDEKLCVYIQLQAMKIAIQNFLCALDIAPCSVAVSPSPVSELSLGAGRSLQLQQSTVWSFFLSFTVPCSTPTCDNEEASVLAAAATISDLTEKLSGTPGITFEAFQDGYAAALSILQDVPLGVQAYYNTVSYGVTGGVISETPVDVAAIPTGIVGFQLVGIGYCADVFGEYYGAPSY